MSLFSLLSCRFPNVHIFRVLLNLRYPKQPLREAAEKLLASNASSTSSKRLKLSPSPSSPPTASASTSTSTSNAFWSQQPGKGTGIAPPASGSGTSSRNGFGSGFGFKNKNSSSDISGCGLDISNYNKLLEPYRVNLKSLKKNCEYQVSTFS